MKLPRFSKGFTLVELLIVIAIIGILSGFAMASIQGNISKARDAQRRNDLKQLQSSLQAYFNDHSYYPPTCTDTTVTTCDVSATAWRGPKVYGGVTVQGGAAAPNAADHSTDYIPNLASQYINQLPLDPQSGRALPCPTDPKSTCYKEYIYRSNGSDYKLIDIFGPEGAINPNDQLVDQNSNRNTSSWAVSSSINSLYW